MRTKQFSPDHENHGNFGGGTRRVPQFIRSRRENPAAAQDAGGGQIAGGHAGRAHASPRLHRGRPAHGQLEHCLEQIGQSETFHEEHEEIDAQLAEVQKARGPKQARDLLLRAVLRSREHFDKEERIVFPLAERLLKARTLSSLGDAWMKRRDAALK